MPSRRSTVPLFCLISMLLLASAAIAAKSWKPVTLQRVVVGVADVLPGSGGKPVVDIPVSNKSPDPVRVALSLRPPAPAPECSTSWTLEAQRDTVIVCPQEAIVAGDYVISVAVLGSSDTDTLEAGSTSARFEKKDVKAIDEWLQASRLPKTFKNVEKVDKLSAGTTFSSMFGKPHGNGTLTVDSTGVTYQTKKDSIVIPAAALRDVTINDSDPKQPWVVVSFEEEGNKKSLSFKPNVYKGDGSAEQMAAVIRAAMATAGTAR